VLDKNWRLVLLCSRIVTFLDKLAEQFIRYISILIELLMAVLVGVVFVEVVMRYLFGRPISSVAELTQVLFPWMTFLAAIEITKNEEHLAITLLRYNLPKKLNRINLIFIKLIMIFFSYYMIESSIRISVASATIRLGVLRFLTKAHLYSSMTVAFTGIFAILIYQLLALIFVRRLEEP